MTLFESSSRMFFPSMIFSDNHGTIFPIVL